MKLHLIANLNISRKYINWDKNYGKTFKLVHTPEGQQSEEIEWTPDLISVVTPQNGDAWTNWPEIKDETTLKYWKDNWFEIQQTLGYNKYDEIIQSQIQTGLLYEASSPKTSSNKIAELNDSLRRTFLGGEVVTTVGLSQLPANIYNEVMERVQKFNEFNSNNDPYGEHDMGMFKVQGESFMWKIDYYDLNLQYASPDPSDPSVTKRVLTIMLSSEY